MISSGAVKASERILMLHKPQGYEVTRPSAPDQKRYPSQETVYSLLPIEFHEQGWVPVGRLDKDSTGLLMFVREGPLVWKLQAPGNIEKVYEVWVKGHLKPEHLAKILRGVKTSIGPLKARSISVQGVVGPNTLARVVLDEGKNRHIRRMFWALKDMEHKRNFRVLGLTRVSIGPIHLDVEPGRWRFLSEAESEALLGCVPGKKKS